MHNTLKLRDNKGYTLLESMLQLLIMIIFINLVVIFFFWKATMESHFVDYTKTEWELFSADVQLLLSEVDEFNLQLNGISLKKNNKWYQINQNGSVLRQQTSEEGHVPLLTGVKNSTFLFDGVFLTVHVIMQDNSIKERSFAVGLATE